MSLDKAAKESFCNFCTAGTEPLLKKISSYHWLLFLGRSQGISCISSSVGKTHPGTNNNSEIICWVPFFWGGDPDTILDVTQAVSHWIYTEERKEKKEEEELWFRYYFPHFKEMNYGSQNLNYFPQIPGAVSKWEQWNLTPRFSDSKVQALLSDLEVVCQVPEMETAITSGGHAPGRGL